MTVTLRNYRGPEDIHLQNSFWLKVTRDIPWCWKPTISPLLYAKGTQFDPRSRCFAFDGERLVGYMSFTGQGEFVSLGYPWVLPGYEGALQEELYERVYGFAAGPEYGGTNFAQRFRAQWTAQISFFERHGFVVQRRDPLYALDLRAITISQFRITSQVECPAQISWDDFQELSANRLPAEQLSMWKQYFQTVDFDFAVRAQRNGRAGACMGIAIRPDTGFAELIAVAVEPAARDVLGSCLGAAAAQSRSRKARNLGTKAMPLNGTDEILAQMGFKKVSEELLLSKSI
jgi:N-acetylglutamate synthase-like GNAT family acetyltransferase